jgi:negative regulator of genetic competence, sporulation and motility
MKKIIYILALLAFTSCEKDQEVVPVSQSCNCGQVTDSKKLQDYNGHWYYTLTIQNNCSDSDTNYISSVTEYNNYLLGDEYCFPSKEW